MYRARIGYEAEPKPYLRNIHKKQAHDIHIMKMREIKSRKVREGWGGGGGRDGGGRER